MWSDFKDYINNKYNLKIDTRQGCYNIIVVYKNIELVLYNSTMEGLEKEFIRAIEYID